MPVTAKPIAEHPAEGLSKLVPEEIKQQLLKTPKALLIENPIYEATLTSLRNNYRYSYIVQWIYLLKHVIKLSDAFDVENFEEELLGIAPPTFINNLKIKLIQHLKNQKLVAIDAEFDFFVDQIYKDYNLMELDDQFKGISDDNKKDIEEEEKEKREGDHDMVEDQDEDEDNDDPVITYSKLPLSKQVDVLYNLIKLSNTKSYANYRKNIEKFEQPHIDLKIVPVFEVIEANFKEEYLILQDARFYMRKWEYRNLELPMNRADFDKKFEDPYDDLMDLNPKMVHWECLTAGLYQYDDYIRKLKSSFGKKSSSNEYALSKVLEANIDFVIQHDLKKRKQSAQRKRDIEMQLLMANRKRSSRLEEKERKRKLEEEERMKELEILKLKAAEERAVKRQRMRESRFNSGSNVIDLEVPLSREERLKQRQNAADSNNDEIVEISESEHNNETPLTNADPDAHAGISAIKSTTHTTNVIQHPQSVEVAKEVQVEPIVQESNLTSSLQSTFEYEGATPVASGLPIAADATPPAASDLPIVADATHISRGAYEPAQAVQDSAPDQTFPSV